MNLAACGGWDNESRRLRAAGIINLAARGGWDLAPVLPGRFKIIFGFLFPIFFLLVLVRIFWGPWF
jgi:hypothetical protein